MPKESSAEPPEYLRSGIGGQRYSRDTLEGGGERGREEYGGEGGRRWKNKKKRGRRKETGLQGGMDYCEPKEWAKGGVMPNWGVEPRAETAYVVGCG